MIAKIKDLFAPAKSVYFDAPEDSREDEFGLKKSVSQDLYVFSENATGSRLPPLNAHLTTRVNILSLQVYHGKTNPSKYLKQCEDVQFLEFAIKIKQRIVLSVQKLVRLVIEVAEAWNNTSMFSNEVIGFIIQQSNQFIVGSPFESELVEPFCLSLFADTKIIEQVEKLHKFINKSRFKKFRRDISTRMASVFNLTVDINEFANDLVSKFMALWMFALLDIN
ncbi:hypothetical protein CORT_0A10100 [Candida orthopsilosis Co 90-125]|uniref:Uncharacterized protein n=1 Tax=Candida orthopsilosis (strain 90-125) TaxID=1136231 RepID=H8WX90_CANO9|nr:hypothetical protein CORT_0A10100 [Candida orthopsilosis Co 90-125]CCG21395.1 hypothetical protein CORT_0A10100 [Candida orthopsilosis Co 90-125]